LKLKVCLTTHRYLLKFFCFEIVCIIHRSLFYSNPCYHKLCTTFCGFLQLYYSVWHSFILVIYSFTDITMWWNQNQTVVTLQKAPRLFGTDCCL
jgi:hypothetical protein